VKLEQEQRTFLYQAFQATNCWSLDSRKRKNCRRQNAYVTLIYEFYMSPAYAAEAITHHTRPFTAKIIYPCLLVLLLLSRLVHNQQQECLPENMSSSFSICDWQSGYVPSHVVFFAISNLTADRWVRRLDASIVHDAVFILLTQYFLCILFYSILF
jgi:hypothetical protein